MKVDAQVTIDRQRIAELAKARLTKADTRLAFHVIEAGIRQDNEWWTVPVIAEMADGRPAPREYIIGVLANAEEDILEKESLNVLFVTALRGDGEGERDGTGYGFGSGSGSGDGIGSGH